mgnify:CR=1 FL=1
MENIIKNIIKSDIWKNIHSSSKVENAINYLKNKNLDYKPYEELIDFMVEKYDIDRDGIKSNFIVSTIMVSLFPNELIGESRIEEEELIVVKSKEIHNIIIEGNKDDNLHKKIYTFKILFENWKNKDKEQQLDLLSEMYYKYSESIDENINDESKNEYVKELVCMKQKIIISMKNITENYRDHLENYKYKNVEYDSSVNKMIYTKLKYIYWENIRKYIFTDNNVDILHRVVLDYKELIKEIKVIVDVNMLDSLLEYDINENNITQASVAISKEFIKINKQIDSENYDEIYDMVSNKITENNKYLVDGFKLCFDRLEIIKKIKMNIGINST